MVPPWVTVAAECMWAARVHRSVEFGASDELNWTRVAWYFSSLFEETRNLLGSLSELSFRPGSSDSEEGPCALAHGRAQMPQGTWPVRFPWGHEGRLGLPEGTWQMPRHRGAQRKKKAMIMMPLAGSGCRCHWQRARLGGRGPEVTSRVSYG